MSSRVIPVDPVVPSYSVINEFPLADSLKENELPSYNEALTNYSANRHVKLVQTRNLDSNTTTISDNPNRSTIISITEIINAEIERKLREAFPLRFVVVVLGLLFLTSLLNLFCAIRDMESLVPVVLVLTVAESTVGLASSLAILALSMYRKFKINRKNIVNFLSYENDPKFCQYESKNLLVLSLKRAKNNKKSAFRASFSAVKPSTVSSEFMAFFSFKFF